MWYILVTLHVRACVDMRNTYMEVRGGGEPQSGMFFHLYKLNTARRSHLKPV